VLVRTGAQVRQTDLLIFFEAIFVSGLLFAIHEIYGTPPRCTSSKVPPSGGARKVRQAVPNLRDLGAPDPPRGKRFELLRP
jgi:hypothetical protein